MRTVLFSMLILALLVPAAGCDSGSDGPSDAEIFVGVWAPVSVSDGTGDQTQAFRDLIDAFVATLRADDTFTVTVDYSDVANAAGRADVSLAGTYMVTESTKTLTLTAGAAALPLGYTIQNENRIALSGNALLVNAAFGTSYEGNVTLVIARQ